jgi:hypothetical protein
VDKDEQEFDMSMGPGGIASMRYAHGYQDREPYLKRARDNAALTIPFLFREQGFNSTTDEEIPWNSGGAYLLANMGAKLILVLFPVGRPPMKLKPGQDTEANLLQMAAQDPDQAGQLASAIDLGLSGVEQEFVECVDEDGDRAKLAVGALKLLCGGNHAFQFKPDGTLRGISLEKYVTWRDASSNLLEFVIEDVLAWESLPEDIQAFCQAKGYKLGQCGENNRNHPIKVYTRGLLKDRKWHVNQEVYGETVPGSDYVRDPEAMDYFFPGWMFLDGEPYARSYVEHYIGDLQSVEGIAQTVQEGAAAIAKLLTFISPTGLTSKKAVAEARNGAILSGRKDDIYVLENNRGGDMQTVMAVSEKAEKRLAAAFLLNSSVQRSGERVTAEEIRFVAGELEDAQAGAYSQQVTTWQQPYVRQKLFHLMKLKRVTPLPMNTIKVTIVGGMGGLARNAELQALDNLVAGALQALGPTAVERINMTTYWNRRAAALGVKTDGLIYSEEYMQQKQQQEQQQQLLQQMGPEAIKQLGSNITSNQVADTNAAAKAQPPQAAGTAAPQGA